MAKKKNKQKNKATKFQRDPFNDLKGFSVSAADPESEKEESSLHDPELPGEVLFSREMSMLGVERLSGGNPSTGGSVSVEPDDSSVDDLTEQDQFMAALGEMSVCFEDHLPDEVELCHANPRRMKLLKQGRVQPETTLDLHGLFRHQVSDKVQFFLQDAVFQGYKVVLIVTGRGLHSQGEPVLRNEVERFLQDEGRKLVVEWARAPRKYGGDGALVVFLKGYSGSG